MRVGRYALLLALVQVLTLGCSAARPLAQVDPGATADPAPSGDLTVFAAASLTDAFTELGRHFEDRYTNVEITFNFAGSSTLSTQLAQGAAGDVFASADHTQMDALVEQDLTAATPIVFASNELAIAVEAGNPNGVRGLADLSRDDLVVVLAAPHVPAGQYAQQALDAAGVRVEPASLEPDVRAVLSRVRLGEADAGIVYRSDVASAGADIAAVEIPPAANVTASYPIAPLVASENPAAARAFVSFVTSQQGRELLVEFGFAAPDTPGDAIDEPA